MANGGRHSDTSPFGKLDAKLDLFLSESTKNGLLYLATSRHMSLSEYVRLHLDGLVHGQVKVTQAYCAKADPITTRGISDEAGDWQKDSASVRELIRSLLKALNTPVDGL